MSQITRSFFGGNSPVDTLTGNSGGPVPPTGGNINVLGDTTTIDVVGNPGTSTLTISATGSVAISYPTDSGVATPALGILNVFGGTAGRDINTSGAGHTIHIDLNNAITLGDLAPLAANSGAVTATTGDVIITAGDLTLPNTNNAGNQGIIKFGGLNFVSNYGTDNAFFGPNSGNTTLTTAFYNTGVGTNVLDALTTGQENVAVGWSALTNCDTGLVNCAFGGSCLEALTSGESNTASGYVSCRNITTGDYNSAFGGRTLMNLVSGNFNAAIGMCHDNGTGLDYGSGELYTTNESFNIVIGHRGVIGDQQTIRIGNDFTGVSTQKCFIYGIDGVNIGSVATVVTESGNQLGTSVITAGTGITVTPGANTITIAASGSGVVQTITGNTGGAISPTAGNINIITANSTPVFAGAGSTETLDFGLSNLVLGSSLPSLAGGTSNVGMGNTVFGTLTSGLNNVGIGTLSSQSITSGQSNTSVGYASGRMISSGLSNSFFGTGSGTSLTTTSNNTGIGTSALTHLVTGVSNIALGNQSAINYTTNESSNIIIGNSGTIADANTIRIGTQGGGAAQQNLCYIAGITGVNVGSVATVVSIAAGTGQLGETTITAGTGISVSAGANTITISSTGTTTLTVTPVSSSPYVVLTTDDFLAVNSSGGPITIQLPNAPTTGRVWIIKDSTGSANTNNITVTTVGGAVNIDGATTYTMNTQYAAINVIFDGSAYEIY